MIATSCCADVVVGNVRIQPITPYLVRIEEKGPKGFEDRTTFTVLSREAEEAEYAVEERNGKTLVLTALYRVSITNDAKAIDGVRIETPAGRLIRKLSRKDLKRAYMPSPGQLPQAWVLADHPRVVPPEWGALPPPEGHNDPQSGWDAANNAPDLYVFFPSASGYEQFRADFLRLTGPVPMPPLYAFGLWYSRYHPYSDTAALELIDKFRERRIPLDVFVNDTDWRVGASCGYEINTNLFPDMRGFLERAHGKNVRVMFNDHPEPKGAHAFDPKELRYRREGLTSLLEMGADVWWFDRNWHTHLHSPMEGLNKEVWGMRLYHDVTRAHRPDQRPLIMSNVDGIMNGHLEHPSHPAAHRFPVWWTGDTVGNWDYLRLGVVNGVDCGIHSLLPYVNEDLGGHHDQPSADCYTRFMQFGALSPIARIHCSCAPVRYPWFYSDEVEQIVGDYFRLRYRLFPMLYAAARAACERGVPLMRRCDLEWPQYPEAADSTQYLLGDDLLVAPIITPMLSSGISTRTVWIPEGAWEDAWTGETHAGPATITVEAPLSRCPLFVRRGGIVMTVPQSYTAEDLDWGQVIVDAYAPGRDAVTARVLYEDDGSSMAYTNGSYGNTRVEMERRGSNISLRITPSEQFNAFRVRERAWTLRVHLPAGLDVAGVSVDGRVLEQGAFEVLAPAADAAGMVFQGSGSVPPPRSGPVIEVRVGSHRVSRPLEATVVIRAR